PDGKIAQRLSWSRGNAYFYEVEIEKLEAGGQWTAEMQERTEDIAIEVSLAPGMYRYRVHSYNVLGRIAASSDWTGIRVFVAKAPAAERFSPLSFHVDSNLEEFTLVVSGADLVEEAQVYLAAKNGDTKPVAPLSVSYRPDERELAAVFSGLNLALGLYDIVITNPGGISQTIPGFAVDFTRKVDLNVSAGYAPFVPRGGYLFERYDSDVYPLGFYGRVNVIPFKKFWGSLGAETSVFWNNLETAGVTGAGEGYTLTGQILQINLDGVYQKWFNRWTMALLFRAGFGFTGVYNIGFGHENAADSKGEGTLLFTVNGGVSFYWLLWRELFVETGIDYARCFSSQSPAPGFLRATAGLGWKF
ncbi:MAG: hypothetical protein LBK40_03805, partial [Spirochaetaceae bacterium]|nr:hypothetical protein [Spirochaetaceae bacterium]